MAQANPTCDQGNKYSSMNYKSTTSNDQNTKSSLEPRPTLVNTPNPAYHRHSPCPFTNSLPHPTRYAISHHRVDTTLWSHHPSDYRSTVPQSPTTPFYPLYNQSILNPYLIPSSSSNICTRTTNTLSYFSPHRHPTSIPHPTPQYPGWVTVNDTKGHNCEWPYFFMGSDAQCTTTIEQHDGGDESNSSFLEQTNLFSINQLQHPGTQHKETKAQSTIDIWIGK